MSRATSSAWCSGPETSVGTGAYGPPIRCAPQRRRRSSDGAHDLIPLDPIRPGQQRWVLTRRQFGTHHHLERLVQGVFVLDDHHSDLPAIRAAQDVGRDQVIPEVGPGQNRRFGALPIGAVRRGDQLRAPRPVKVGQLRVHGFLPRSVCDHEIRPARPVRHQCQYAKWVLVLLASRAALASGMSGYRWPRPAVLVNRIRMTDSEKAGGASPLTVCPPPLGISGISGAGGCPVLAACRGRGTQRIGGRYPVKSRTPVPG